MLRVNGRAYDWGDVDFQMPGLNIQVQEISYNDELEKEVVYGAGQRPRGYGEGNYKSEGKISLLRDDYDELLDYCKRRNIKLYKLVIPKIAVSYANPGSRTRTDILSTVTFTKTDQKAAQGDKSLKVDVVGEPGRTAVKHMLPELKREHGADFIIVNGITRDGVKAV